MDHACLLGVRQSRGRVWEVDARDDGGEPRLLTHVGGTLLGAAFDDHGDLYVADSTRGLIRVPAEAVGHAHTHANSAMIVSSMAPSHLSAAATDQALAESEIRYADDVAVAGDTGFIYFTDATKVAPIVGTDRRGDTFRSWATSHLSGEASGRVLCYVPDTGETIVVATGLRFANGIGVSRDGSHLIVAATSSYKLVRMPTLPAGVTLETAPPPKTAQELQDFHDGPLPGFPDGVSVSRATGHVWTTVFVPVPPVARLGDIAPRWVRSILVRLPHELRPKPRTHSMFAEFFPNGTLVGAYHDRTKQFALLSSVEHCDGPHLFAGALNQKYIARFDLGA